MEIGCHVPLIEWGLGWEEKVLELTTGEKTVGSIFRFEKTGKQAALKVMEWLFLCRDG